MWRYRLKDYEPRLLAEIQRQQNSNLFCDTLLQTSGVSIPAHSCIIAALSPYLSKKVSALPSPPSGNRRQLQLQSLKAQTLLKLVGLLYSGELKLEDPTEQGDVLAAARRLRIGGLVEIRRDGQRESEGVREQQSCRYAETQAEIRVREAGIQTVKCNEQAMDGHGTPNSSNHPSTNLFNPNNYSTVISSVEGAPNATHGGTWNSRDTPLSGSSLAEPQRDFTDLGIHGPASYVCPCKPHIPIPSCPLVIPNTPEPSSHPYTSSNQQSHSNALCMPPPDTNPQSVEESPEEIERLLKEIMMGLNILPSNLEINYTTPHNLQPNLDRATTTHQSSIPNLVAKQSRPHPAMGTEDWTPRDNTSLTDTGFHSACNSHFVPAKHMPELGPDFTHHPKAPQCCLSKTCRSSTAHSLRYPDHIDERSFQNAPVTQSALSPHGQTSCRQKRHYPACQSSQSDSLACMEDVPQHRCLPPSEPCANRAKHHQPSFNHPTSHGNTFQQSPLEVPSWQMTKPGVLQFPLSHKIHREETCPSLHQVQNDTCNTKCVVERCNDSGPSTTAVAIRSGVEDGTKRRRLANPKCMKYSIDTIGQTLARTTFKLSEKSQNIIQLGVCSVSLSRKVCQSVMAKEREMATSSRRMLENAGKSKKPPEIKKRKMKPRTSQEKHPGPSTLDRRIQSVDLIAPKRKPGRPRKITQEHMFCVAPSSDSSHNVESVRQSQAYRKVSQESREMEDKPTTSDNSLETHSGPSTLVRRIQSVDLIAPKRTRGRPNKTKQEHMFCVAPSSDSSHNVESVRQSQAYRKVSQESREMEDKPKKRRTRKKCESLVKQDRRCRKRIRNKNGSIPVSMESNTQISVPTSALCDITAQIIDRPSLLPSEEPCSQQHNRIFCPGETSVLKPNIYVEDSTPEQNSTPEHTEGAEVITTKRPPMVTLKQFQELIKHRHWRTRESKKSNGGVESQGEVSCGTDSSYEEFTMESEMEREGAQIQGKSEVKKLDTIHGFPFDQNPHRIITAKNCGSEEADKSTLHMHEKKQQGHQSQNKTKILSETVTEKEGEESSNTCVFKSKEAVVNYVPSEGNHQVMPDEMENHQLCGKEDRHNEKMKAKAIEQTESPSQNHPLPCFATAEERRKEEDIHLLKVAKMADNGGEMGNLQDDPDKVALEVPTRTNREYDTEQPADTTEDCIDSLIRMLRENKLSDASETNPHTL